MTFTVYIIAATVLVSIACFNNAALSRRLAFSPYRAVRHGEWYRLLTHGFVHADWMHLFVNMFTFYSFGLYIESVFLDLSGSVVPFLLLYFGGMIVASLHDFKQRADPRYSSIGASGAVSAVLFSAIFLDPWNKIYLFAAIPIPGILFGLCYLFYCHYMAKQSNDNINHHAHLFGAIYGFIFPPFLDSSLIQHFIGTILNP